MQGIALKTMEGGGFFQAVFFKYLLKEEECFSYFFKRTRYKNIDGLQTDLLFLYLVIFKRSYNYWKII